MLKEFYISDYKTVNSILKREENKELDVGETVKEIIENVKNNGDEAVKFYNKKFDGADTAVLEVTKDEIESAIKSISPKLYSVMEKAKENIYEYHSRQKDSGYVITRENGVVLGRKVIPLDSVGLYIPGGTAAYPSSVLMNVIPAKIAGVKEIIMVTPPGKSGDIAPAILTAAYIAGVDKIFKVGGAQAVAALAYGTQSIPRVDKITGPGNIYVTTAKKLVHGIVDIDMIAGPSEILIIADESANPHYVTADLLSQAEHDKLSASFLVTTSKKLAAEVQRLIPEYLDRLRRKEIAGHSIRTNGAVIITEDLTTAVQISNEIAPEHLEICTEDPFALLPLVRHAGSVFLGHYCPEALGDYLAGPNHTLPTSGTAKFSSGLSVEDFVKKTSFLYYTREAMISVADDVDLFAREEGLDAHGLSAVIRKEELQ